VATVIRREAGLAGHGLPPGRSRIISPYDTDTRYSEKRGQGWRGYKVHLTGTCHQPSDGTRDTPGLITNVATTEASVPDVAMTEPVHAMLEASGLAPAEHAVDSGYTSADLLADARKRGITLLGPLVAATSPQARTGGYTTEMFDIDWDHQRVTCPQGAVSHKWSSCLQQGKRQAFVVGFPVATCRECPVRAQCTSSAPHNGRRLFLRPREIHEAVAAARAGQSGQHWKDRYKIRAGVEGTIRQATCVTGIRTARYLGLPKTSLEHAAAAAAVNLIRLDAWWTSKPLNRTRTTHLQRLTLTPAA
jgi:Transposase DDE domain